MPDIEPSHNDEPSVVAVSRIVAEHVTVKLTVAELRMLASKLRMDAEALECAASDARSREAKTLRQRAFYFDQCADSAS